MIIVTTVSIAMAVITVFIVSVVSVVLIVSIVLIVSVVLIGTINSIVSIMCNIPEMSIMQKLVISNRILQIPTLRIVMV